MDLRRLRFFVKVVDFGSIGRAAEACAIAQPALSQHMAAIEAEVKAKLLIRGPHGVVPTDAGMHFYRHAQAILRRYEEAVRETTSLDGRNTGSISIGVPTAVMALLGMPLLEMLVDRFPHVSVRLIEGLSGSLQELAVTGRLDLVFLYIDAPARGLELRPLLREDLFLLDRARPGDSGLTTVTVEEVARTPLVLPGPSHGLRILVEESLARIGARPRIVAEVDSHPVLLSAAGHGLAATVMSWAGMSGPAISPQTRCRKIVDPVVRRPVSLCISEAAMPNEAASEIADAVTELVRRLVEDGTWRGVTFIG